MQTQPITLISGFSGAGKTTFWKELLSLHPEQLTRVTTYTTRDPREGEVHGRDYHFISPEEFHKKIVDGHFLEWSEHYGNHYGSPAPHELSLENHQIPLYTVDTNGVMSIKDQYPQAEAFFLYISPEEQYRRLSERNTDPELIKKRLIRYEEEAEALKKHEHLYHILRNEEPDDLKKAIEYFRRTMQLG